MDGTITIGTELDTKKFDRQIQHLEAELEQMEKSYTTGKKLGFKEDEDDLKNLEVEIEKTRNKLVGLYKQKMKLNTSNTAKETNKAVKGLNSSLDKSVKKAGKLALAIFGVRSAYMYLRRASSELASYDEQYATDLEYIQFALTQAIAPALKYIVELAGTLLSYINAITQAWFGINLFANGSAEAFNKMKRGASGTSKAVKEIKKQLLGFDEINMLTDQSDTGTSAGAGGVGMPSFDFGGETELPDWVEFIIEHKDEILKLGALGALIGIFIKSKLIGALDALFKILSKFNAWDLITGAGDVLAEGLNKLYEMGGIVEGLTTGVSRAVSKMVEGFEWIGSIDALAQAVEEIGGPAYGALRAISEIVDTRTKISIKSLADAERDLENATTNLLNAQNKYIASVDKLEEAQKALEEAERKTNISGEELYNGVKEGTISYMNMTEQQREVYKAYLDTQTAQENLDRATQNLTDTKKKEKLASLENQLALANEKKEFGEYKNAVVDAFKKGEISSEEARHLMNKSMVGMSDDAKKTFTEDLPTDIKEGLDTNQYDRQLTILDNFFISAFDALGTGVGDTLGDAIGGALRNAVNGALSIIENKINSAIRNINSFISGLNNLGLGGVLGYIGRLSTISLPRLKTGGIINMPNTGRLVGGAIAGESGKEGVLPLTDRQAMEELGRTIGKYITVNANVVNTMNGRVISRELKQIQNEQDFVYNT